MKKSVLFLPASIRSHVVPALYLADLLAEEYDIYFAVTNEVLEELVTKQGYNAIRTSTYRVALGMEAAYLAANNKRAGKWEVLKSVWNNDVFEFRQKELLDITERIRPTAVFIDIFNSTDLLVLDSKHRNIKLLFMNPMLSTYRVQGFPAVMEGFWPDKGVVADWPKSMKPLKYRIRNLSSVFMNWLYKRQFVKIMKASGLADRHPVAVDMTHALLFENIPECVMAPHELEFSLEIKKPVQEYFGLCISENRQETELDNSFEGCIDYLKERKRMGDRILYCAFGTYFEGNYQPFLNFLNTLLDALLNIPRVQLIVAVNNFVQDSLLNQRQIPSYVRLYTRVPQLDVLQVSDLHITHGGMGSIKESILYAVPMLVFPLEPKWDNNGNSLKIQYHGLGLTGSLHRERSSDMWRKIECLLTDQSFKDKVILFRNKILKANAKKIGKAKLDKLIQLGDSPARENFEQFLNF